MPLVILLLAALAGPAAAQGPSPLWGVLDPGPYAVGFRVVHTVDRSRSYWPPVDWQGRPAERLGRPVQLLIWYPATRSDAAPLHLGRYLHLRATTLGDHDPTEAELRAAVGFLRGPLRPYLAGASEDEVLERVVTLGTRAVEDAVPAPGRFPVVVTVTPNPAVEQGVRWEYLASHGYVVIGVQFASSGPAHFGRGEWTPEGMEAMGLDFGFAVAHAATLTFADHRRVAAVGAFTAAGLLHQARTMGLAALASLEGSIPDGIGQMPGWEAARLRMPILSVLSREGPPDDSAWASLRYADRTLVRLDSVTHAMTYPFARFADRRAATALSPSDAMAVWARWFLDAHLRGDDASRGRLDALRADTVASRFGARVTRLPALPAVPSRAELLALLREKRVDEALAALRAARVREPGVQLFTEQEATIQARFALFADRDPRSIVMIELVAEAYPDSWRIRELLGDAHTILGRRAAAGEAFAAARERVLRDQALAETERREVLARLDRKAAGVSGAGERRG